MQTDIHLKHFTECIRESKRPIGLLFGAGCPKSVTDEDGEPLIPDTKGMRRIIRDEAIENGHRDIWEEVVGQVKGDQEDESDISIERILSQVRGLHKYSQIDTPERMTKEELNDFETIITEEIVNLVSVTLPDKRTGFENLSTWLGSIDREEPVEIFTTNYDLLIEEALENHHIPYFDGFVGGNQPFFDRHSIANADLPDEWIRLWKLHGSMNWVVQESQDSIRIWRTDSPADKRAVIHPSNRKYDESRKMPYLTLIDQLKDHLKKDDSVLFVVGYSFEDEHINDIILQALREEPSSTVFAFMYGNLDGYDMVTDMAESRGNFCVFAQDSGIIGTKYEEWATREEEPSSSSERIGIEWCKDDEEEKWDEVFTLGDFESFGEFLRSVTGYGWEDT